MSQPEHPTDQLPEPTTPIYDQMAQEMPDAAADAVPDNAASVPDDPADA